MLMAAPLVESGPSFDVNGHDLYIDRTRFLPQTIDGERRPQV